MTPEFSRPVLTAQIGQNETLRTIEASPEECTALAKRLGLPELIALSATFRIIRQPGDEFLARGEIHARALRNCVVSLDDFTEAADVHFTIRFVAEASDEIDILEAPFEYDDGPDEVVYENGTLDLGEATVQEYALSLSPYPRKPGVVFEETVEDEDNAFAVLKKLTRPN